MTELMTFACFKNHMPQTHVETLNSRLNSPSHRKMYQTLSWVLGCALSLNATLIAAASEEYVALVEPVAQQQPEALMSEGLQALYSANQSLSQSWLSDAVAITVTHENDALTDHLDTQNWAVGAEFSLLLPKQQSALQAVSEAYQDQLSIQQAYLNWLASGKLRQLVWTYTKAKIELDLAESALKKSIELQENVQRKVEVGDSAKLDSLLAEKFVVAQQALAAQKQSQLKLAQNQFTFWTKQSQLPGDITEALRPSLSLSEHPELRWIQSAYEVSKAQHSQQKTMNQDGPSFFVGAQNDQNNTEDNTFLFVEVSIPIGKNPMNQVSIAEKQQTLQAQRAEVARAEQALNMAILAAEQTILTREKDRSLAQRQHKISQETLRLAEQAYQLGESSIQSLLLIKKEALAAQLNVELASADLEQAIANANQIMGYPLTDYPRTF